MIIIMFISWGQLIGCRLDLGFLEYTTISQWFDLTDIFFKKLIDNTLPSLLLLHRLFYSILLCESFARLHYPRVHHWHFG